MRLSVLLFAVGLSTAQATTYYVSPSATAGDGSFGNPWPLRLAITNISTITAGDVILARGGTYRGPFICILSGSSGNHITIRNYPNERVIINDPNAGVLNTTMPNNSDNLTIEITGSEYWPTLTVLVGSEVLNLNSKLTATTWNAVRGWDGSTIASHSVGAAVVPRVNLFAQNSNYVTISGLEFTSDSITNRINGATRWVYPGPQLQPTGTGNKLLDSLVYNVAHPGIGFWKQGAEGEVNGCISWGVGDYYNDGTAIRGSAIYSQNEGGMATIKGCINFRNFTTGGKVFGETGPVRDFQFLTNFAFANGQGELQGSSGSTATSNLWFNGNWMLGSPSLSYVSVRNSKQYFINNGVINGTWTTFDHTNSVYTNNLTMMPKNAGTGESPVQFTSTSFTTNELASVIWDRNTWYLGNGSSQNQWAFSASGYATVNSGGGGNLKFNNDSGKAWIDWWWGDANSTYAENWPTSYSNVVVYPLDHNTNKWFVCVVNTTASTNASIAGAALGLVSGQRVIVRDSQNYFTELTNRIWTSGSVLLPIWQTNVSSIPGVTNLVNKHTNVDQPGLFNVFVIEREAAGNGLNVNGNLTVNGSINITIP